MCCCVLMLKAYQQQNLGFVYDYLVVTKIQSLMKLFLEFVLMNFELVLFIEPSLYLVELKISNQVRVIGIHKSI
jgi:hypothetical protein